MTAKEELTALRILRGKILDVMSGAIDVSEIESYNYGDADGAQSVKRRDPTAFMKMLNDVDKKITALERSLQGGGGIMTFGTNRYVG